MVIFRSVSFVFTIIGFLITMALAWFIPWVFVLHLGVLVYFPYEPKSEERFMRITGPWAGSHKKNWVSGNEIPKACKLALVAAEDTKFFIHHGIDFESLEKSYEYNQRKKKTKRGGSTITQQLVKNAFLSRERSYLRKAREIVGAVLLDATASKDFQLNWYLNIVEFGPNIYGLKEAAQFYFRKPAAALSQRECVSLVAILPSPNKWNKSLKKGSPSGFLAARIGTIQARMNLIPTNDEFLSSTTTLASNPRKTSGAEKKPQLSPPKLPTIEGEAPDKLQQAELQAEKAELIDLPEENLADENLSGRLPKEIPDMGEENYQSPEPTKAPEFNNPDTTQTQ